MTEDKFVEEAFAEADQMEVDKLRANADLAKIIASDKKATEFITIGDVKVYFTPFVSRPIRRRLSKLQPVVTPTAEEAEEVIYQTLAVLCTEYPYNQPLTWKFIEADGGDVGTHLAQIMGVIVKRAEQMRKFQ